MNCFESLVIEKLDEITKNATSSSWIGNLVCSLSGVLFGAILTLFIQRNGKIRCYLVELKKTPAMSNGLGAFIELKDAKPDHLHVELVIDIQNSFQRNIGLRDIFFEIRYNKKKIMQYQFIDKDENKLSKSGVINSNLEIINIDANKIIRKRLETYAELDSNITFSDFSELDFIFSAKYEKRGKIELHVNNIKVGNKKI